MPDGNGDWLDDCVKHEVVTGGSGDSDCLPVVLACVAPPLAASAFGNTRDRVGSRGRICR